MRWRAQLPILYSARDHHGLIYYMGCIVAVGPFGCGHAHSFVGRLGPEICQFLIRPVLNNCFSFLPTSGGLSLRVYCV